MRPIRIHFYAIILVGGFLGYTHAQVGGPQSSLAYLLSADSWEGGDRNLLTWTARSSAPQPPLVLSPREEPEKPAPLPTASIPLPERIGDPKSGASLEVESPTHAAGSPLEPSETSGKLTYRRLSQKEFEALADKPLPPVEFIETPAPIVKRYARKWMLFGCPICLEPVDLYVHTLGNLVLKDEAEGGIEREDIKEEEIKETEELIELIEQAHGQLTHYEFVGHIRHSLTGSFYTIFRRVYLQRGGGVIDIDVANAPTSDLLIFYEGRLTREIYSSGRSFFLSPGGRYFICTGNLTLTSHMGAAFQCYYDSDTENLDNPANRFPPPDFPTFDFLGSGIVFPGVYDLQSNFSEIPSDKGLKANDKEIEYLFATMGCRSITKLEFWSLRNASNGFIMETDVEWYNRESYSSSEPSLKKTYYILFSW